MLEAVYQQIPLPVLLAFFVFIAHIIVITDIIMPEKEGFETIKDLKRERPGLPILAISGGGVIQSDELLEMAVSMGASAGLSKPFTGKALLAAVQKALDLGA